MRIAWIPAILLFSNTYATLAHADGEESPPARVSANLLYGQTGEFWSTVNAVENHTADASALQKLIDDAYDSPREGIAHVRLRYEGPASSGLSDAFSHGYFGAGADALAGGQIHDRIYPELKGYSVYTGEASCGFLQRATRGESGWEYQVGTVLGAGTQSSIQGAAADLLSGAATTQQSSLYYWGGDFSLGYRADWDHELGARIRLALQPTLFHADFTDSPDQYAIQSQLFTLRWKGETEWTAALNSPFVGGSEVGLLAIVGQQPVPVDILPRVWDSVHQLQNMPSVGQLIGLGTSLRFYSEHEGGFGVKFVGGYFGGYLGAGAEMSLSHFVLSGGTWGFEDTSGYDVEESRIQYVALGIKYDI